VNIFFHGFCSSCPDFRPGRDEKRWRIAAAALKGNLILQKVNIFMADRDSLPQAPKDARRNLRKLKILWQFVGRHPGHLVGFFIGMLTAAGASLLLPQAMKQAIDKGFTAETAASLNSHFMLLGAIVLVMAIATAIRFYFVTWIGERVVADVRQAAHKHLLSLSPSFFEENRPAEIASRLTSDTSIIEMTVGTSMSVAMRNSIMIVGGIVFMAAIALKLTAMMMLIIPAVVIPITIMGRKLRALSRGSQDKIADIGAMADEAMGAIRVVQAFTQEKFEQNRFSQAVENAFIMARKRFTMRAVMTAIVMILAMGGIVGVLWTGAQDVIAGRMSGGDIAAFIFYAVMVGSAVSALTEVWGDVLRAVGAASRLEELLGTKPSIEAPANPAALPQPAQGRIEFAHVTFRYPSRPDTSALHDFSLNIQPGETVALVGPSGAGKTTLFQLIQRFYDPHSGSVAVDGVKLTNVDPQDLRQRIALVPQDSVIFAASAYDNIAYGRDGASEADIWAAAEAANAAEFLRALPDGIHSYLGEGGARLSGGQRQRIAIARAILRDAPILLLDEATSALDAESERVVQEALDTLMQNRTTLVIAHRLATVVNADRIVVLDGGRIDAIGTHGELIAAGGLYARLAELQFQGHGQLMAAQRKFNEII
jgi:ATP-binding cassette, subfamily B, bacterial